MTNFELTDLFNNFFSRKITKSDIEPAPGDEKVIPTTFRLPADLRNYYQLMADHSRTTLQGVFLHAASSIMNKHLQNQASIDARSITDRFYKIFVMHGVKIYDIPLFLKDFNISTADITNDNRLIDILSDEMIDFIASAFNLNKNWIISGDGEAHISFDCYKQIDEYLDLMHKTQSSIRLNIFFDKEILKNPDLGLIESYTTSSFAPGERYAQCILLVEDQRNGVLYTKPYNLEPLDWDYAKTNNHIYALIEGMNITKDSRSRSVYKFAGSLSEVKREGFVLHMLNNFKNYDNKNLDLVYSDTPLSNVKTSSKDFLGLEKTIEQVKSINEKQFKQHGYNIDDYRIIQPRIEELKKLQNGE